MTTPPPLARGTTVVIPVWDDLVDSLPHALASCRDQVDQLIVVDNASRVELPALDGANVVTLPTRTSVGAARNRGLKHVPTPLVLFLDADDALLDGAVATLTRLLTTTPGAVAACSRPLDPTTNDLYHWPRPWMVALSYYPRVFVALEAVRASYPIGGSLLVTDHVRTAGGSDDDPSVAEDWVLAAALARAGRIVFAERPCWSYTPRTDGLWATQRSRPLHNRLVVWRRLLRRSHV